MDEDCLSVNEDTMSEPFQRTHWELPRHPNWHQDQTLPDDIEISDREHKEACIQEVTDSIQLMKLYMNPIEYNFHLLKMIKFLKKIKHKKEMECKRTASRSNFNKFQPTFCKTTINDGVTQLADDTRCPPGTNLLSVDTRRNNFDTWGVGTCPSDGVTQLADYSRRPDATGLLSVDTRRNSFDPWDVGTCPSEITSEQQQRVEYINDEDDDDNKSLAEDEDIEDNRMTQSHAPAQPAGYTNMSVVSNRNNTASILSRSVLNSCTDLPDNSNNASVANKPLVEKLKLLASSGKSIKKFSPAEAEAPKSNPGPSNAAPTRKQKGTTATKTNRATATSKVDKQPVAAASLKTKKEKQVKPQPPKTSPKPKATKRKSKTKENMKPCEIQLPLDKVKEIDNDKKKKKKAGNKKAAQEDIFDGFETSMLTDINTAPMSPGAVLNSAKKCWGEISSGRQTPPTSMLGHLRNINNNNNPNNVNNSSRTSDDQQRPNNRKQLVKRVASKKGKGNSKKDEPETKKQTYTSANIETDSSELDKIMEAAKAKTLRTPTILKQVFRQNKKSRQRSSDEDDDDDCSDEDDDSDSIG